ncbi:MAG TPA: hypothetical protein VGV61_03210 [Thermoanaerobaculia bacterium]|jgi:hypothetical protein|nr:hypothetical protein [Thermoanaerobaculia bacterium]
MTDADRVRLAALDRIDRAERHFKLAFFGAACIEIAFLGGFLLLADLHNRMHLLLLLATVATYTIVAAGLFALGAHVSRNTQRVLRAIGSGQSV